MPNPATAESAKSDDDDLPVLPLTQEVLPRGLTPPPLPPPDANVQREIQPEITVNEDNSLAGSDITPTAEAIAVDTSPEQPPNESSTTAPHDPEWNRTRRTMMMMKIVNRNKGYQITLVWGFM